MEDRYICRAKRLDNGEWLEGYYFSMRHNDERTHTHHFLIPLDTDLTKGRRIEEIQVEIDIDTLCRCTGLMDKNDKPIWENDIVTDGDCICEIVFKRYQWACKIHTSSNVLTQGLIFPLWQWDGCKENGYRKLEVRGNKIDNPELLEV